jgi:hypothetical protein
MVRVACIGVGGRGWLNLRSLLRSHHAKVVGLCDVDTVALARAHKAAPNASAYSHAEALFDRADDFDAVVISTPDHSHAELIQRSIQLDKHCFCEKPLVSELSELLALERSLERYTGVSCLGCQAVTSGRFSYLVQWLSNQDSSALREIVAWTEDACLLGVPTVARLSVAASTPGALAWDAWLGHRERVPFSTELHPVAWRRHVQFGSGAIGDIGSHLLALPVATFGFESCTDPFVVNVKPGPNGQFSESLELSVRLLGDRVCVPFRWLHGDYVPNLPPYSNIRRAECGLLFIFDELTLYCPEWNFANAFVFQDGKNYRLHNAQDEFPDGPDILDEWLLGCNGVGSCRTSFQTLGVRLSRILLSLIEAEKKSLVSRDAFYKEL